MNCVFGEGVFFDSRMPRKEGLKQMILDWFNTKKEKQFGQELATYVVEKIPPAGTLGVKKEKAKKIDIFNKLFKKVDQYKREHRLNFYKKSVFGNSFQWTLIDAGFTREFAKELTTELLLRL